MTQKQILEKYNLERQADSRSLRDFGSVWSSSLEWSRVALCYYYTRGSFNYPNGVPIRTQCVQRIEKSNKYIAFRLNVTGGILTINQQICLPAYSDEKLACKCKYYLLNTKYEIVPSRWLVNKSGLTGDRNSLSTNYIWKTENCLIQKAIAAIPMTVQIIQIKGKASKAKLVRQCKIRKGKKWKWFHNETSYSLVFLFSWAVL